MIARSLDAFPISDLDLLVIENVGNLICPAAFDLGESLRVVVCSVAEGPEKPKKYPVMFNKANVVLINKIDLAFASGADIDELAANVRQVSPHATIFMLSSRTGEGLEAWTNWLQQTVEVHAQAALASV
jgi:hydrogenase nickel incorporation protein HypB